MQNIQEAEILLPLSESVQVFKSNITSYGYHLISNSRTTDQRILNKILWRKILDPEFEVLEHANYDFGMGEKEFLEGQPV